MADTLREFLVGLGFKVDESSERRFVSAIEGATLRANLLADAIENMARVVVDKVGQVASNFEQLYYQSQRVGASAQSIRAFEYAVSQLGGTTEGANTSLESFGRFLRNTPGALSWVSGQLHVQTKDIKGIARDNADILLDIGERLSHMPPFLAERYRTMLGVDEKTLFAIEKGGEAKKRYGESLKSQGESGITGQAMKEATKFEQAWRDVWQRIGNMAEGGESKLFTALTEPMEKFGQWLDRNSPQINEAITNMATSVGTLTTAWVEDLNKVHWGDVATDFDNVTKSISGFVSELSGLVKTLVDFNEQSKDWWIIRFLNGAANPAQFHGTLQIDPKTGKPTGYSGPGSGVGDQVRQPWDSSNPAGGGQPMLKRAWDWISRPWSTETPFKQNGAPISDSNPLAVNVVKVPSDASGGGGGGGFFGGIGSAISHLFGGGGGGNSGPHGGSRGIGGWWTPDRMSHAVDRLMKEGGLTREGAAGLVARWSAVEASGGPTSVNGSSGAAGIGQWLGSRKNADAASGDFDRNLNHAIQELNTTEKRAGDVLRNARTGREGARGASMFERAEGYNGASGIDNFTGSTPAERVLGILDKMKQAKPVGSPNVSWDHGHSWDSLNAALPVGGSSSTDNSSKNVSVNTTNTYHIQGSGDPATTAGMIGLHMDRSANTISRNLQGAFQ